MSKILEEVKIIKKNVKRIILRVQEDYLSLTVPKYLSNTQIDKILQQNKEFIEEKAKIIQKNKLELIDNEKIEFLGKTYKLKIISSIVEKVSLENDFLIIFCKDQDNFKAKEGLLNKWYKAQANDIFSTLLDKLCQVANVKINALRIRKMKTRWGSCNSKKAFINLNLELIKKPQIAIEAVIMHELTHLYVANHSKAFYDKLIFFMPDYYERIKLLKSKEL